MYLSVFSMSPKPSICALKPLQGVTKEIAVDTPGLHSRLEALA